MFWFLDPEARGILASPEMEPAPPPLEGEVLTTGPPGKSQSYSFCPFPPAFPSFGLLKEARTHGPHIRDGELCPTPGRVSVQQE